MLRLMGRVKRVIYLIYIPLKLLVVLLVSSLCGHERALVSMLTRHDVESHV